MELLLQKRDGLVQATVFTPEKTLRSKITSFLSPLRHHPNLDELERSRGLRAAAGKEANEELCTPSLRGSKPQSVTKAARTFAEPAQKLYDWYFNYFSEHLYVFAPKSVTFTIHHSPFTIHNSPFKKYIFILPLPFTENEPLSINLNLSLTFW